MGKRGPISEEHRRKISEGIRLRNLEKRSMSPQGIANIRAAQKKRRERERDGSIVNNQADAMVQLALAIRAIVKAEVAATLERAFSRGD